MVAPRFAIFGPGGFGRELVLPTRQMLAGRRPRPELVFVSDDPKGSVVDVPHLAADSLTEDDEYVIAVGDSAVRRAVSERLAGRAGRLIAPNALIGPDVEIGEGAVFCPFTMATASARIGRHFHCNIYSYVAHDCVVGDFVTFAPKVCCNGNIHIGDGVYVGTGAVIRQGRPDKPLLIGDGAVIGMGAVVTKDVAAGSTVIGNPARPMERR